MPTTREMARAGADWGSGPLDASRDYITDSDTADITQFVA